MPDVRITREDWSEAIDNAREKAGKWLPVWVCLFAYYSVCITSLATPLSLSLWAYYRRFEGFRRETFESYNRLPSIMGDAIHVIEAEVDRIEKGKQADRTAKARKRKR